MTRGYYTCPAEWCWWVETWSLSFARGISLPRLDLIMTAVTNSLSVVACLFLGNLNREIGFTHLCGWEELTFLSLLITNLSPANLKVWSNCKSRGLPQCLSIRCLFNKMNINQEGKGNFSAFICRMAPWQVNHSPAVKSSYSLPYTRQPCICHQGSSGHVGREERVKKFCLLIKFSLFY